MLNGSMNTAEPTTERDNPAGSSNTDGAVPTSAGDAVSRLDFLTVLRVRGGDALTWLQGQLTADIGEVDASASRVAAWCSPKGRVLAIFRLLADPAGGYRVICEHWFTAALLARLRMFVMRSEVEIDDAGDELGVAGVAGTRALPDRLAAWATTAGVDDAARIGEMAITRVPGRQRRFMVTGPHHQISSMIESSRKNGIAQEACPAAWRLADICAGVARITADSSDAFLPQMLNLDRLRAVSFEKGCYVGQEIVARAEHLGRVKRRAYVGRTTAAAEGDPIVDAAGEESRKVGDVVASEPHPGGGTAALVVINVASAGSTALRVGRADGPPMRISFPDAMDFSG